jgi:CDP-glycerol glycerophosphotransferase
VISNNHLDVDWAKRSGAVYFQIWHGTPLKRIHWDVLWAPEGRLQRLSKDVARWDWLLSPNRVSTPRLRNAFRFHGEVVEAGYPRNDVLVSADAAAIRSRVRARLKIPEHTAAVLYAPTWRDDVVFDSSVSEIVDAFKLEDALAGLGTDYCVLRRLHYMVSHRWKAADHPQVRDVSYYPEAAELYLAADVLITDYSSVMFDFAVTGKPIVFYVHDLADFRDRVRGFYFDLAEEAPGPLLTSVDDVVEALRALDRLSARYTDAYAAFQQRYCDLADGRATDRVLARIDRLR